MFIYRGTSNCAAMSRAVWHALCTMVTTATNHGCVKLLSK